jgi:uncharacterized protein Smg (DUF494 family)
MQDRIVEILVYVLNEVRNERKGIEDIDTSILERKGYSQAEITMAFSWLLDRLNSRPGGSSAGERRRQSSFRILHDFEKHVITPQAFGYLMQLRALGIISEMELETVIERCMLSGFEALDLSAVQSVVATVLFDAERPANHRPDAVYQANDTLH